MLPHLIHVGLEAARSVLDQPALAMPEDGLAFWTFNVNHLFGLRFLDHVTPSERTG